MSGFGEAQGDSLQSMCSLVPFAKGCSDFSCLPTNGFSIEPLKVKLFSRGAESNRVFLGVVFRV